MYNAIEREREREREERERESTTKTRTMLPVNKNLMDAKVSWVESRTMSLSFKTFHGSVQAVQAVSMPRRSKDKTTQKERSKNNHPLNYLENSSFGSFCFSTFPYLLTNEKTLIFIKKNIGV